jgi:hypothetical protein
MNLLAISKSTTHIAYAIFHGKELYEINSIMHTFYENDKMLYEYYQKISEVIKQNNIGVVAVHKLDESKIMKRHLKLMYGIRTAIQFACIENKSFRIEVKTDGWEKYITNGRNTLKKKVDIVNKGYGINLKFNLDNYKDGQQELADAIILGEGVAHKRIYI